MEWPTSERMPWPGARHIGHLRSSVIVKETSTVISKEYSVALKKFLIRAAPPATRRQLLAVGEHLLNVSGQYRKNMRWVGPLPDFLIIGAQKCGTTYLYDELVKHPNIAVARTKEIHFFDAHFAKGVAWYRTFFPRHRQDRLQRPVLTGEASPSYLFYPHTARRVYELVPHVKVIVLLRNPVDRAYSHYNHEVRLGFETLSFEDAIEKENERLLGELDKTFSDETYYGHNLMHYAYLARGIYVDQIRVWRQFLPKEHILVVRSEDFYGQPTNTIRQVQAFLGLPDRESQQQGKPKVFPYPKMSAKTRQNLLDHFKPHNQRLNEYLGVDFGWTK
jgi:hypothetical protein